MMPRNRILRNCYTRQVWTVCSLTEPDFKSLMVQPIAFARTISFTLPARHVTKVPSHALRKLQTSQMFANKWNHWRTLTADSLLFNGAFNDLDTMQILTEHAVALQQYSCSGRRTLAETYLLSPAEPHSSSAT
jgi:hypothetical protein